MVLAYCTHGMHAQHTHTRARAHMHTHTHTHTHTRTHTHTHTHTRGDVHICNQVVESLKTKSGTWDIPLKEFVDNEVTNIEVGDDMERWVHPLMSNEAAEGTQNVTSLPVCCQHPSKGSRRCYLIACLRASGGGGMHTCLLSKGHGQAMSGK